MNTVLTRTQVQFDSMAMYEESMSLLQRITGLFRRSSSAVPPWSVPGYEVTGNYTEEDEADIMVLNQLRDAGCDLTKPRHVVNYLYFARPEDREDAAADLEKRQYEVHFSFASPESATPYFATAERVGLVNESLIFQERELLKGIADRCDGKYDGWEAQQS